MKPMYFALFAAAVVVSALPVRGEEAAPETAAVPAASAVPAAALSQVRLEAGGMTMIDPPFAIRDFSLSNSQIAKVEITGERQVRVSGLRPGSGDLQLTGDAVSKTYRLIVSDNLTESLAALKKDLDSIPEIRVGINRNRIVLQGEISSLENWSLLEKVLKYHNDNLVNLVQFRPAPEAMLKLQKALENAGYKIAGENAEPGNGELSIRCFDGFLMLSGTVYSPEDVKKINAIIGAMPWISIGGSNPKAPLSGQVNVRVAPETLELNAVCIGFDKSQVERIGYNFVEKGIPLNFTSFYKLLIDDSFKFSGDSGDVIMKTNLETVLQLFCNNTDSYFRRLGYVMFQSNDTPVFRELHDGGTLKVKVSGIDNGSLQDIPYGFILKVKGGLTGVDSVAMEIEMELSSYALINDGDYDVKKNKVTTSISCKLGETIAIAGFKEFTDNDGGPKGVPFLRHIPGLKYFFSESNSDSRDKQVLVVISPTLASRKPAGEAITAADFADTDVIVRDQIREREKEKSSSLL